MDVIDDNTKLRRSPNVAGHNLGSNEGGVLLHLQSGQYHGVNNVGWAIWSLLDRPHTISELVAGLQPQFAEVSGLAEDVRAFVDHLLARDLLEVLTEGEH